MLLIIYRKIDDKVEVLSEGSLVKESDQIQISYVSFNMKYGMIFSIDGNGTITLHYPDYMKDKDFSIIDKHETFLPHTFILDNAPYFERFFFITSNDPFTGEEIIKAAEELIKSPGKGKSGELGLSQMFKQHSTILYKTGDKENEA